METQTGGEAAIYTFSKVTIGYLKNHKKHGFLIEKYETRFDTWTCNAGLYILGG